ncbi:MAG: N-acetylneuraminate synthase [Chromatiales bacterium]|nr:N-acetylneuraminate synthase [Chromatiales bacterium]
MNHPLIADGRCLLIAEAGVNHNGDLDRALQMVDVAASAGADAIKFQSFRAESLVTQRAPKAGYQVRATGKEGGQLEMLQRLELSASDHRQLKQRCEQRGILFLSTPFDEASAGLLNELGVPAFKVSSGDLTDTPYLTRLALMGPGLILSTGMATLAEVGDAVAAVRRAGRDPLALLHCVSNYPTEPGDVNLRAMLTLAQTFGLPVGFSDHTEGIDIALAAVALGARIVEKHFTLNRSLPGPDHRASLEPDELCALVEGARRVERALGDGVKRPRASEADVAAVARRSLHWQRDLPAGSTIRADMLMSRRPADGLPPAAAEGLCGRVLRVDVKTGEPAKEEQLLEASPTG